ncbi:MAG TPA: S8 family serine peptidase [Candidatus Paceibacterota bacterium]|nr:S8 family serine peptidase [Candidatus Paceibacterota bacterium]
MTTKKALFLAAISVFLITAASARAAESEDHRYFIQSTSQFLKKSFSVRSIVDGGFTADASDWQLKIAKLFGVSAQPVKRLSILADDESASPKSDAPSAPIGWGTDFVYGGLGKALPHGGDGVSVAILDTGADVAHPDLKNRIVQCADFTGSKPFTDKSCFDDNGHGTHVAGIIAADGGDDGSGIYGVAPEANLLIYKVCDASGACFADDVASAIQYAADQKANIILISVGSDSDIPMVDQAIKYAVDHGVLVIAAAGNDGPYDDDLDFPAMNEHVVSVGALNKDTAIPDWSSRGNNTNSKKYIKEGGDIEFAAPGVSIESTWKDDNYAVLSGTSMAAAHVAGLAAKEWQTDAKDPAGETRDLLHTFSLDLSPAGDDNASGWGAPAL